MIAEKRLRDARWVVRWHVITYQTKKNFENLSRHFVPSLHFVPGLQSASCAERIGIAVSVRASLKSEPKYCSSKKNSIETILAAMIDMWTICWRAHEEMYRNGAMINFYQLKTNANVRLTIRATSDALSRGHNVSWNEPATGPLGVNISASRLKLHFQKFGNVIWGYYFFY